MCRLEIKVRVPGRWPGVLTFRCPGWDIPPTVAREQGHVEWDNRLDTSLAWNPTNGWGRFEWLRFAFLSSEGASRGAQRLRLSGFWIQGGR